MKKLIKRLLKLSNIHYERTNDRIERNFSSVNERLLEIENINKNALYTKEVNFKLNVIYKLERRIKEYGQLSSVQQSAKREVELIESIIDSIKEIEA